MLDGGVQVVAILSPSLLNGRTQLGKRVQELLEETPLIAEQKFEDFTPKCPRIHIAVEEGPQPEPLPQQAPKAVTWRVAGRPAQHALVFLTATEFTRAADDDGLSTLLHTLEGCFRGHRLHVLTCQAATNSLDSSDADGRNARNERLWQVVADLAAWRPDVAFFNASSQEEAAQHVWRVTRSVAEEAHKQTTVRSYLCALPKTAAAQEKSERLEKLLARYRVQRGGSQAALMRALLAVPGVSPEAAYAAAMQFESLQQLLEHAERHGADQTRAAMACLPLPLPASPAVVGAAAAGKIVAALCQQHARV